MRLAWLSIPIIAAVVTTHLYGEELLTEQPRAGARAPEFTHQGKDDWINSAPLSLSSLRGRVLLVDFWTFDCWNCYRSFPWLNAVHEMFASRNLQIVGVHSPEFRHEREPLRVAGETHRGDARAREIERRIAELIAEQP